MNTKTKLTLVGIKFTLVSGRTFLPDGNDRSPECPIQEGQNSREIERTPEEIIRRLAHLNEANDHDLEDPCWKTCRFICPAKERLKNALIAFLKQK